MNNEASQKLMEIIAKAGNDRLAKDIVVLDVQKLTSIADYFVIMTASNDRQLGAIVDNIEEKVLENGYEIKGIEGRNSKNWFLIDCYDVIAHVFTSEDRAFYNIEKLWSDAPIVNIDAIITNE